MSKPQSWSHNPNPGILRVLLLPLLLLRPGLRLLLLLLPLLLVLLLLLPPLRR